MERNRGRRAWMMEHNSHLWSNTRRESQVRGSSSAPKTKVSRESGDARRAPRRGRKEKTCAGFACAQVFCDEHAHTLHPVQWPRVAVGCGGADVGFTFRHMRVHTHLHRAVFLSSRRGAHLVRGGGTGSQMLRFHMDVKVHTQIPPPSSDTRTHTGDVHCPLGNRLSTVLVRLSRVPGKGAGVGHGVMQRGERDGS